MTSARLTHLSLATVLLLQACSGDAPGNSNEKIAEQAPQLREVPRPASESMQAAVYELLNVAWLDLQAKLAESEMRPEQRAEAFAEYGLSAFGNGLTLAAEAAFSNAASLAPAEPRWVYFLALLHQYNGDLDNASLYFEQVLELLPRNQPTLIRFAAVRFEQARMQDAEALYRQALEIDSESAAAYYGLGRVANATGDYRKAVEHFNAALERQPFANRINYFLALAWRNLGDNDKAQAYLVERGTNEPHFSDPLFDQLSGGKARIEGLWAHMNSGSQALVDGNYALAVAEFQLATQDLPDDYRSWQSLGIALNKTGDSQGALEAYRKALSLSPDSAAIHYQLAGLLIKKRTLTEAEQHLQKAIAIDPGMLDAQKSMARLLVTTDRAKEALDRYAIALSLDPQSAELIIARAEVLASVNRASEAAAELTDAIAINPNNINLKLTLALILSDLGQARQAEQQINNVLAASDDSNARASAHYALGQIQLGQENVQAAVSSFGEALKLNPKHQAAGLELARSFLRLRDFEQALRVYDVVIAYWPENNASRVEAARVAVMLGNGSKAKQLLQVGAEQPTASARLLGSLARLLVLSTESEIRNPALAIKYAERALALSREPQHLETLALCQSATGDFSSAVETQQSLLSLSNSRVSERSRTRMQKNLQRYRDKSMGRLPFDPS